MPRREIYRFLSLINKCYQKNYNYLKVKVQIFFKINSLTFGGRLAAHLISCDNVNSIVMLCYHYRKLNPLSF